MERRRIRVLIIEDDEDDFFIASRLLKQASDLDLEPTWEQDYEAGLAAIRKRTHDVALVDYRMGRHNGLELLREAGGAESPVPIILLTGQGDHEVDLQAMEAGAADYLIKWDVDAQALERAIRYALERKRVEDRLRESESRYRLLAENVTDLISTHAPNGTVRYASPASEALLGYAPAELVGQSAHRYVEEGARGELAEQVRDLKKPVTLIHRMVRKDGSKVWVEATVQPVYDDAGEVNELIAVTRDITERKRAEDRIREQAALLDKANDVIVAYDLDGDVVYWNKSAEQLTGWSAEEVLGRSVDDELYEPSAKKVAEVRQRVLEAGEWAGELRLCTRADEERTVESRWTLVRDEAGRPASILVINTDVTEQKELEAQFFRAQRMESIGRLVSGIAHDLGNLLVPVLLGTKIMRQRYDDERTARTLEMMEKSAQRGSDMVKQVLAFARGVEGERVPTDIEPIVSEIERITEETFPHGISVETNVADDVHRVEGDATQLQQVVMNLCVNARDAMPEGGRLTIAAANVTVNPTTAKMHLEAEPGPYVRLSVADTGSGIPPHVLDKIFEPFFTTKDVGKGTGLGLSTVYSIIKSHRGFINVYSEDGRGTTFHIYLPVASTEDVEQPAEAAPSAARRGEGELILVVDDEEYIRVAAEETLVASGYRVVTAADGRAGLEAFRAHDDVQVVVTDMAMPEMDGLALIRALREENEQVPIVAASGMPDSKSEQALGAGARQFLTKPFTADVLLEAIHHALEARTAPAS